MNEPNAPTATASAADDQGLVCPGCGYSLFGIDSDRCPECGLPIDRTIIGQSQLLWAHRKTIGRFKAFWKTVVRANLRPSRIAMEVNRPVSLADARLFRRICVAIAWLSVMPWVAVGIRQGLEDASTWECVALTFIGGCALALFLFSITGVASYFFHPAHLPVLRQNRAIAISHYAAAALAWTWIPSVLLLPLALMNPDKISRPARLWIFAPLLCVVYAMIPIMAFILWSNSLTMLKNATHCPAGRRWAMGIILPAAWAVLAGACLVAMPAIVLFVIFVIASF